MFTSRVRSASDLESLTRSPNYLKYRIGNLSLNVSKTVLIGGLFLVCLFLYLFLHFFFNSNSKNISKDSSNQKAHLPFSSSMPYNNTYPLTKPVLKNRGEIWFRIAVIADSDTNSKKSSTSWQSHLKYGTLIQKGNNFDVLWDETSEILLESGFNYGGRGMELSELIAFNGHLYTMDDRTGIIYRIQEEKVIPWIILSDGNGFETKGFKAEWATVKNEHLYVGGIGKEWTTSDGNSILNNNPMFVKIISHDGIVSHCDWKEKYMSLRSFAGISFPGYIIHEAVAWSEHQKQWVFLPRRASTTQYNEKEDEHHGTNMILTLNDQNTMEMSKIGESDERIMTHGFSSFKFIPNTDDGILIAIKSEEVEGNVSSYLTVFNVNGKIYYPETKIGNIKYEGIEFV